MSGDAWSQAVAGVMPTCTRRSVDTSEACTKDMALLRGVDLLGVDKLVSPLQPKKEWQPFSQQSCLLGRRHGMGGEST